MSVVVTVRSAAAHRARMITPELKAVLGPLAGARCRAPWWSSCRGLLRSRLQISQAGRVSSGHLTDTAPPQPPPGGNRQELRPRRLTRARLKKSERAEIASLYERLDAERAAAGLPPADRVPWSPADILEWQDLTPGERYLDLKTYALASDRIARAEQRGIAPDALRVAA